MIPPILAAVLGMAQQGGQSPQGVPAPGVPPVAPGQPVPPPAPGAPPVAPAPGPDSQAIPPDIIADGTRLPLSQYHTGLLHGMFGVGHTGGNILGALGDAFLTQAGHAAQYAPRLQQAREAEALQDFGGNPSDALKLYSQVAPGAATLHQYDVYNDNQRQQAAADSTIADNTQNRQLKTRSVVGAMINAANKDTFPAMIQRAQAYASANGLDETLPTKLEDAKTWASGSDSIADQDKNAALEAYRANMMDYRNRTETDKNAYYKGSLGVRQQQADTQGQRADQQGSYQTGSLAEKTRHDQATEAYNNAHPRGAKPGAGTATKFAWDPAKGKYVAQ